MHRRIVLALPVAMIIAACSNLPPSEPVDKVVWLEQGEDWEGEARNWFHHVSQGTATLPIPFEWFMALEQPGVNLFGAGELVSSPDYLARLGFIPGKINRFNQSGLPVGFAVDYNVTSPVDGRQYNAIGFTCAACHTGQMTYQGTSIRYDGGPAVTDITEFTIVLFLAMFETRYSDVRFNRFAARVLGEQNTKANRKALKKAFSTNLMELIDLQLSSIEAEEQREIVAELDRSGESRTLKDIAKGLKASLKNIEGFARLDALNRIGNQVFALDANRPSNFVTPDAPVNYPHIWSSSWFEWVQYDGSIMQPMVRNAGEALGVAALVNLEPGERHFDSTVRVDALYRIEQMLAGSVPPFQARAFTGLQAPKWPEQILGAIDREQAAKGQALYGELCQGCHLPATSDPAFWSEKYWSVENDAGERLLRLKIIPADDIGTDPAQSRVLADRKVDTRGLGIDTEVYAGRDCEPLRVTEAEDASFAFSLGAVVQETTAYWYRQHGIGEAEQRRMNGERPNCLQAPGGYKARPLNGIWATAPFLHNGSVPDLYALLSPADERPDSFYLGNREFDPVRVGYRSGKGTGLTRIDTSLPGNHNSGHEFDDDEGPGVIGPALSEANRMALIEYLKTL
ncbi:hypothetical protein GCM10011348_09770 [Marinobacterium nitratireducens]|uniref:Cytochrome c domain-containing protein n=1 Tax=Marinobacterium nitratireducens TaxID=518897 RepID=A0A917Z8Y5_9GAMM|nr:di-heme-cytochrome C peroxidase [Marinobacterium nitratireducens]GGO78263.1 hypothetical protein GCM10011348_09770 [Marinobacterium nitratireducens]